MSLGPVMLDIDGLSLSPADRDLLREPAVGGVILFSRNYESPEQLIDLVAEIRALRSPPLIVAVDHEGGRVQRFREGFSAIPPMSLQITGRPWENASWMTTGEFSHQVDGVTTQSTSCIRRGISSDL